MLIKQTFLLMAYISSMTTLRHFSHTFRETKMFVKANRISAFQVEPPIKPPRYQPKTPTQVEYVNALANPQVNLIVATGPAGTGKSLFACSNAIQSLKKKQIEKIVLTRPLVSVAEEEIGFLPGNLNNKMAIWVQPMMDIFKEHITKKEIDNLIHSNVIEITPLLYMRGRTFKNSIIIADEIQNTTPQQLLMLLTRCGEDSKIIITGDVNQSDLKEKNGLADFIEKYKASSNVNDIIKLIQFEKDDIQRSELVKQILNIYNPSPSSPPSSTPSPPQQEQTNQVYINQNSDRIYMNQINNYISKISSEYGDYVMVPSSTSTSTPPPPSPPSPTSTPPTKTINSDSALIPIEDVRKLKPYKSPYFNYPGEEFYYNQPEYYPKL
jgi:phosphate starvation-inducible PhoH-like protein